MVGEGASTPTGTAQVVGYQPVLRETYHEGRRGLNYVEEELTKSHNVSR